VDWGGITLLIRWGGRDTRSNY